MPPYRTVTGLYASLPHRYWAICLPTTLKQAGICLPTTLKRREYASQDPTLLGYMPPRTLPYWAICLPYHPGYTLPYTTLGIPPISHPGWVYHATALAGPGTGRQGPGLRSKINYVKEEPEREPFFFPMGEDRKRRAELPLLPKEINVKDWIAGGTL